MKVSDFDYGLPDELIANNPPEIRGSTNLLVLDRVDGKVSDKKYCDIVEYLNPGDVLVLNDTKVMKARLIATKNNGAKRELVILEKHTKNNWFKHQVIYRGRISKGDELFVDSHKIVVDEILGNGVATVSSQTDLIELSEKHGVPPLPPYMKRDANKNDIERYQTVFAKEIGSAAAPTASLNMTKEILEKLRNKGIVVRYVTLHVGLGTFLPIRTENVEDHQIHSEYFIIPNETIDAIAEAKRTDNRIVALGTTVARTLEYAASHSKLTTGLRNTQSISGEANIFIYPGYKFKCIDALVTNFHAPGSTVLMLTAALAGWDNLKCAYAHAINQKYSFLSYGDSMLII